MHSIHTTPGLIIGTRPYGEAGKIISIFTRDFGLVSAVATGIRLEKSKLRYHTQEYYLGTFSLVKGREYWRLTSAAMLTREKFPNIEELDELATENIESEKMVKEKTVQKELIARISLLLRRLLQGEEARPEVFEVIMSIVAFLGMGQELSKEQLMTLESLAVARILHWLGYIGDDKELNGYMMSFEITSVMLDSLCEKRATINKHINKALKESHM